VRDFLVAEREMELKLLEIESGLRLLGEQETKPTVAMEILAAKPWRGGEKVEVTQRLAISFW
jgi:hypothetical protein